jgi:hypothetical protein
LGALKSRLERGRERLRIRLISRGVTLSGALLASVLTEPSAAAGVPPLLLDVTVRAAIQFAAGGGASSAISANAAFLAHLGIKTMLLTRLRTAMTVMLFSSIFIGSGALALLANSGGAFVHAQEKAASKSASGSVPTEQKETRSEKPPAGDHRTVTIVGRVEDPNGKPAADAQIAVTTRVSFSGRGVEYATQLDQPDESLGQTKADANGRFELKVKLPVNMHPSVILVFAAAPGTGLGWALADPFSEKETLVRLAPEQVVNGRLTDSKGQPAANVKIHVQCVGETAGTQFSGIGRVYRDDNLPLCSGPTVTDAQGRFSIRGIGRGRTVRLEIRDEPFARQWFDVNADKKETVLRLESARVIRGKITLEDSGKPLPKARFQVSATASDLGRGFRSMALQADDKGEFRINAASEVTVFVPPPDGLPYLGIREQVSDLDELNLVLPRGVDLRGKVVEASGKGISGASIRFWPQEQANPHFREGVITGSSFFAHTVKSGADGRFQVTVLPGPGHLVVSGPTSDFAHVETSRSFLKAGTPGGQRLYVHGLAKLEIDSKAARHEATVALRRGVTVNGRLVGPDEQAVKRAMMLSTLTISPDHQMPWFPVEVHEGRFELRGCDPEKKYQAFFVDSRSGLGGRAVIPTQKRTKESPEAPADALTVRMEPCGSATVRVLNADGTPVGDCFVRLELLLAQVQRGDDDFVESVPWFNVDHRYANLRTDAQGRVTFPSLIAGATYRITSLWPRDGQVFSPRKDFSTKVGERLQLPDIVVR